MEILYSTSVQTEREYPFGRNQASQRNRGLDEINKEAIYGTSHSTVQKQDWGYFTQKGNKLYMCVFNRPINNLLKIEIPKGGIIPMKAYFLEIIRKRKFRMQVKTSGTVPCIM